MSEPSFDYCIVGAGPIGIELAIEFKRVGASYLQVESGQLGQTIVEYAPDTVFFSSPERLALAGIPFSTINQQKATREEYLHYLRSLVQQFSLSILTETKVSKITARGDLFSIDLFSFRGAAQYSHRKVTAGKVILAVGDMHSANLICVPGEDLPHVSHYLDEPHQYFDKDVLIVGGKNSAVEAAIRLHRVGARVTLSYRKSELPKERIKYWLYPELLYLIRSGAISYLPTTKVDQITLEQVTLIDLASGNKQSLSFDRVLLLTGYVQDKTLFHSAGIELEGKEQRPVLNQETLETTVPGIHVIGTAIAGTQSGKVTEYIETSHDHVALLMKHFFNRELKLMREVDFEFIES